MKSSELDGRLQVSAGAALLHRSRLLEWNGDHCQFIPVPRETFEYSWRMDADPVFGRLMCWIHFSAGAEFWLKGLCLVHGIDFRKPGKVPRYPHGDIEDWAGHFSRNPESQGMVEITKFGTLATIMQRDGSVPSALEELLDSCRADRTERGLIGAAYRLLQLSIRNRDAHAYVPNVRDSHYHLVPELFARCLNVMAGWLPGGAGTLNEWRADAGRFIRQLE
jgi:hypothetical protein